MTVLRFSLIAFAVVAADQASKGLALRLLPGAASIVLVPGLAQFTLTTNTGAAFGLLPGATSYLAFVALAVAFATAVYVSRRRATIDPLSTVALALALGGALGNFLDRILRGRVVDFLDVFVGTHHWPVFNVADACICTGVGLLALGVLRGEHPASVPE